MSPPVVQPQIRDLNHHHPLAQTIDRFSSLPDLVLDKVFQILYIEHQSPSRPLSKKLEKYFYQYSYRALYVSSYKQLTKLCARGTTKMLEQTWQLTVDVPFLDKESNRPLREGPDAGWPRDEVFIEFLLKFGQETDQVTIIGSSRLAQLMLSPSVTSEAFPGLRILSLSSTFSDLEDPFHPAHYAPLVYCPTLATLVLNIRRSPDSIKPSSKPFPEHYFSTFSPNSFTLKGPLGASPFCSNLIARFDRLQLLSLDDTSDSSLILPTLLAQVVKPEQASSIGIGCINIEDLVAVEVVTALARFTKLIQLRFRNGFYGDSSEFGSALGRLELRSIAFGDEAKVDGKLIWTLLSGSKRMKSLKVVILDEVHFKEEVEAKDQGEREEYNRRMWGMLDFAERKDVILTGKTIDEFYEKMGWAARRPFTTSQVTLEAFERMSMADL